MTKSTLDHFLAALGFEEVSALTYYSSELEVALSDLALYNVIQVDGSIAPFDIWARRIRISA